MFYTHVGNALYLIIQLLLPAMDSPNLIAVASGIGVTPAISLVQKYSQETLRRVNLVWICRDPGLIEHFITNIRE